jgi:isoleucyl-tRNA synthetase
MPYSWACETPLSNFEIRMDNSYRSRQDPAITVGYDLTQKDSDGVQTKILIWTTTPWTLPSNLAVAVGEEVEYSKIEKNGARYILATAALARYKKEFEGHTVLATYQGKDLVGMTYHPPFQYFKNHPNAFRVIPGDFVTTEDGTGIVHMAPGFGEDDQRVCEANHIELVCPVDNAGKFTIEVSDFAGRQVQEANKDIIRNIPLSITTLIAGEPTHHSFIKRSALGTCASLTLKIEW